MMRYVVLATVGALSVGGGCSKETCDTGEFYDTALGACTTSCDNAINAVFPAQDSTDAYYRTTIEVELDDREDDATVSVSTADGTEVSGTSTWNGDTIVFTPDAALAPSTTYNIDITYSCGTVTTSFTTSEVGAAIDTASLVGKTFALDLGSGRFVEPEGIGSLLGDFVDQEVLIGVQSATDTEIQMLGAIAADGTNPPDQGECDPTIPFPTASFSDNPYFQVGPETTTLSVAGYSVTINDLEISGAFGPNGDYIAGAVLAGTIDTRPLVPLLDQNADCSVGAPRCCDTDLDPSCDPADDVEGCCDEDQICDLAFQIGVSCVTCDSDGQDFCLSLYVDSMQAVEVSGLTLDEKHLPEDDATAPATSTNICDIPACATDPACETR